MTDKDIIKIAELTAKIVIDHIESKQDQWNNEFEVNLEHFTSSNTMQPYKLPDEQELLDISRRIRIIRQPYGLDHQLKHICGHMSTC